VGPLVEFNEGFNDHDRARLRAVLADDFVAHDRRLVGPGEVAGADAYLDTLAVLWDLAPDIQLEPRFALAVERHGVVAVGRSFGILPEGGAFETYLMNVATIAHGRITRIEIFDVEAVDAALARFAELRPRKRSAQRAAGERSPSGSLRIPPNAATRTGDRLQDAREARDWDTVGALCAPALVLDDRRRSVLLTGDRDMLIASVRWLASQGVRRIQTLLATAGDRLALARHLWTGAADAPDAEAEVLLVTEVDAEGRFVAIIAFDPDDRRAATAELFERYARSDSARWTPAAVFEVARAMRDHDLGRIRAALPDDFYLHDHRRTGMGKIEGADDYVASMAALYEQSPDAMPETLYDVVVEKHGSVSVGGTLGTLTGGGEFESVFVRLLLYQGDRFVGCELFELEQLDAARARLEELRPDPAWVPLPKE
jgi:hypothetical protein